MKFTGSLNLKKTFYAVLALLILFATARLMLKGVDVRSSGGNIFLLVILIVFLSASRKVFWFLTMPMVVLYAFYSPIGLVFGKPTYQYVASIFATDVLESKEFFLQIPFKYYLTPFAILGGVLLYRYICVKNDIYFYKNKTLVALFAIFSMFNQAPMVFIKNVSGSVNKVHEEMEQIRVLQNANDWGESSLAAKPYDTYVLVIGESARKDYHHAYGYPVENTPFMSSSKGMLVDGLTSAGTNTIASLRLMLTKSDTAEWEPNYGLTVIDLLDSAGLETYWLSNQGFIGENDTPITLIANKSQHQTFLKYGEYNSENTSDFLLLESFKRTIQEKTDQPKFVVVHLYGSHPNACDRIEDYEVTETVNDKKYKYLECYVTSIHKVDDLLSKLNAILNDQYLENGNSYSMLYFSDHGLAHRDDDGVIVFNNNRASKLHYNIPLFKVSSDDTERKTCTSFKSGLNFVDGIANWVGIRNPQLKEGYSLFDCQDDPNDYGLAEKINALEGEPDPAIDIRGK